MPNMKLKTTSLAALAAITLAGSASAAVLLNTGFETDAITTNNSSNITPDSWTGYASDAKYVADGTAFAGISGGHTSDQYFLAYVNYLTLDSQIRQDSTLLWSSFTVGDSLTVSAWTTYRSDVNGAGDTYFTLNATDAADLLKSGAMNVTTDAVAGAWTLRTWNYTITQATLDTAAANNWGAVEVGLGLKYTGTQGVINDQQVVFDDVSLVHTAIPEPSAALLGGLGMLCLLRRRR